MIVTCYYSNLNGTIFGGRPKSFSGRYLNGILKLSNNSQKKIIYTSKNDFNELKNFLTQKIDEEKMSLYDIKIFELNNQKFHTQIKKLKNQIGYVGDRCLEIQYGKFEFLLNELKNNNDYVWWVDAGLIDEHLFPIEYIEDLNKYNLFNDSFFNGLSKKIDNKILLFCGDRENYYLHGTPDKKYFTKNYQNKYHPIGGFFGGHSNSLKSFLNSCNEKIENVLTDGKLYSEEIIMEIVFSEEIKNFYYDSFTTWVHEKRGVYLKYNEDDKKFFSKNHKPFYRLFL
jgi:hypothetical protein